MPDPQLPSDIIPPQRIPATPAIQSGEEQGAMPSQSFASFMENKGTSPSPSAEKSALISPFDLAKGQTPPAGAPTIDSLLAQIQHAQGTTGDIQKYLNDPQLQLKSSQKYLLKNKLSDANVNLRAANSKLGADVPPETSPSSMSGPLAKFLAYLNDGQAQLQSAQQQLQSLKDKGTDITPGDFLLIQVKMSKASQELEFSSVLLSNAVQGFKQMMQVQL